MAFDVSHLGTVRVAGPAALERLQGALTNDLGRIGPGRAQYTHLLDEQDASVLDDIIVWWVDDQTFDVMPNASNTDRVTGALAGGGVEAVDVTPGTGDHRRAGAPGSGPPGPGQPRGRGGGAVPRGPGGLGRRDDHGGRDRLHGRGRGGVLGAGRGRRRLLAGGPGGRGDARGAGARDTLRLEAGLPLHGHELGPGITPLQAGLGWVVSWDKGEFRGRTALAAERERGISRRLRGLTVAGRRPPRADQAVLVDGEPLGVVTSGNFSPELGHGIALAFVPPGTRIGDALAIDQRGSTVPAEVVKLPFVSRS